MMGAKLEKKKWTHTIGRKNKKEIKEKGKKEERKERNRLQRT